MNALLLRYGDLFANTNNGFIVKYCAYNTADYDNTSSGYNKTYNLPFTGIWAFLWNENNPDGSSDISFNSHIAYKPHFIALSSQMANYDIFKHQDSSYYKINISNKTIQFISSKQRKVAIMNAIIGG